MFRFSPSETFAIFVMTLITIVWYIERKLDLEETLLTSEYYHKFQAHTLRVFRKIVKNRTAVMLSLAWVILASVFFLLPEGERFDTIASDVISILVALLLAYLSADYFLQYSKHSERIRIKSQDDIIEHYMSEDSDGPDLTNDFINMGKLESWRRGDIDKIPAAVESMPGELRKLNELSMEIEDNMYEIDEDIYGMIEPEENLFLGEFQRGNHYSGLLFRLDSISDDGLEFYGEKTTYYRSFVTNFCPDLTFNNGSTTLRKLTDDILFQNEGLRDMSESPLSDHLGVACMCITMDGDSWFVVRSHEVAVEQLAISLPVSGSASLSAGEGDISELAVEDFIYEEAKKEIGADRTDIKNIFYLGTVRRMERLGKPDIFAVAFLEEDFNPSINESEYVDVWKPDADVQITEPAELFKDENVEKLINAYALSLAKKDRSVSTGLLSCLYLFKKVADSIDNE